jgi:hypothetical protein
MTKEDEAELHRLCEMLRLIECQLEPGSPLREGLEKAGLALSLTFLHGLRSDLETWYSKLGSPLTDIDRQHLIDMGINPD